jgi:hypothetical protein
MMMPHVVAPQYSRPWIHVFQPNIGTHFVSPSNAQQVLITSVTEVKVESMARTTRRIRKRKKDDELEKIVATRQKPHKIKIRPRGYINGGCDGKNAWDETIRLLIP